MRTPFETKRLFTPAQAVSAIEAAIVNAIENDCPYALAKFVPVFLENCTHRPEMKELEDAILKVGELMTSGDDRDVPAILETAAEYANKLLIDWASLE